METKHSPLPWVTDSILVTSGPQIVAEADGNGPDEMYANAAFIVKACNAHAALVEALEAQNELDAAWNRERDQLNIAAYSDQAAFESEMAKYRAISSERDRLVDRAKTLRIAALALANGEKNT